MMTMTRNHTLNIALSGALFVAGCSSSTDGPMGAGDGGGLDGSEVDDSDGASGDASNGGDGGGGSGGGSGGGGGDADAECGASPFEADQVPVNVLLVVDKSGSMADTPDEFEENKWTALTGALESSLTDVQDDLSFGMDLYPGGQPKEDPEDPADPECDLPPRDDRVAVDQGAAHVEAVVSKLHATDPYGRTPTAAALGRAREYFIDGDGSSLKGDRYVLLATDGGPNCNDQLMCTADKCIPNMQDECPEDFASNCCDPDEVGYDSAVEECLDEDAALDAVQALADEDIHTVVVGIPGSELFADVLDTLAMAGGVTSDGERDYFEVTSGGSGAGSLSDVLRSVTQDLIRSCDLQLGSTPPDLDKINVEVDGEIIPRDDPDGWSLDTSTDPPTIRLQGELCETVETEGVSNVDVTFGCPTVTVI